MEGLNFTYVSSNYMLFSLIKMPPIDRKPLCTHTHSHFVWDCEGSCRLFACSLRERTAPSVSASSFLILGSFSSLSLFFGLSTTPTKQMFYLWVSQTPIWIFWHLRSYSSQNSFHIIQPVHKVIMIKAPLKLNKLHLDAWSLLGSSLARIFLVKFSLEILFFLFIFFLTTYFL